VVTFPAEERHRPSTSTKLYCLVTEAYRREQLTQCCYTDDHGETRTHDLNDTKSNALPLNHLLCRYDRMLLIKCRQMSRLLRRNSKGAHDGENREDRAYTPVGEFYRELFPSMPLYQGGLCFVIN